MQSSAAIMIADEIMELFRQHGENEYAGERVTQLEHMDQAAILAEQQGFDEEIILAAFLHDIGHICVSAQGENDMDGFGIKDHEEVGADFLAGMGFSKKLIRLVESHVEAKRYLTWKQPGYFDKLSEASKKTLEYQGGRMEEAEALAFEQYPMFELIIQMRLWDEEAKVEKQPVSDLEKYRNLIIRHLTKQNNQIKMAKFQLVVFDMAGTTVEDKGNVADAFIDAFHQHKIEVERGEVKKVMGWRKMDAIKLLLEIFHPQPFLPEEELIEKIHDTFIRNMVEFYKTDPGIRPLPFAEEIFSQLKSNGVKIALNTGFTRVITDTILARLHWKNETDRMDFVISSDEVPEGRPYPFMIETIMQQLNITDPKQVVKVGDTEVDVLEGRNADCGLVVSITTGSYTREQLQQYNPDHIIDSLSELPSLIL